MIELPKIKWAAAYYSGNATYLADGSFHRCYDELRGNTGRWNIKCFITVMIAVKETEQYHQKRRCNKSSSTSWLLWKTVEYLIRMKIVFTTLCSSHANYLRSSRVHIQKRFNDFIKLRILSNICVRQHTEVELKLNKVMLHN